MDRLEDGCHAGNVRAGECKIVNAAQFCRKPRAFRIDNFGARGADDCGVDMSGLKSAEKHGFDLLISPLLVQT